MRIRQKWIKGILTAVFGICAVTSVYPLLWMLINSFKDTTEIMTGESFGLPHVWKFANYTDAIFNRDILKFFVNSIIVTGFTLLLTVVASIMLSYALTRMRWKLSGAMMTYFLTGMMIPVHCILIPVFTRFSKMHLTNSLTGLILPYLTLSLPITIFIMTGFFQSLPNELFESACIDGCSIYRSFTHIALPLARTGLFVTGLMTFVANWNELLLAMVFISDDNKKTLPVSLSKFVGPYNTNYSQMFAAIVIAIIPTIVVYCMFSNQIVDGLTAGAVKG